MEMKSQGILRQCKSGTNWTIKCWWQRGCWTWCWNRTQWAQMQRGKVITLSLQLQERLEWMCPIMNVGKKKWKQKDVVSRWIDNFWIYLEIIGLTSTKVEVEQERTFFLRWAEAVKAYTLQINLCQFLTEKMMPILSLNLLVK